MHHFRNLKAIFLFISVSVCLFCSLFLGVRNFFFWFLQLCWTWTRLVCCRPWCHLSNCTKSITSLFSSCAGIQKSNNSFSSHLYTMRRQRKGQDQRTTQLIVFLLFIYNAFKIHFDVSIDVNLTDIVCLFGFSSSLSLSDWFVSFFFVCEIATGWRACTKLTYSPLHHIRIHFLCIAHNTSVRIIAAHKKKRRE